MLKSFGISIALVIGIRITGLSQKSCDVDTIKINSKSELVGYLGNETKNGCPEVVLKICDSHKNFQKASGYSRLEFIQLLRNKEFDQLKRLRIYFVMTREHIYVF